MIGILTLHGALNYGAALQEYALPRAIAGLSGSAEIVDYREPAVCDYYRVVDMGRVQSVKSALSEIYRAPGRAARKRRFEDFARRWTPTSERVADELVTSCGAYETLLAGSDQVWNPDFADEHGTFFLAFAAGAQRKTAYAASFGVAAIPSELTAKYERWLSGFDVLSVREPTAARIVFDLTGQQVPVVLDPTLLLTPEDWARVWEPVDAVGPYALLYTARRSPRLEETAKKLAAHRGWTLIYIDGPAAARADFRLVRNPHPSQWLWLFAHAEAVFTNTFHGTAFAINFRRPLFVDLPPDSARNSRLTDLLGQLSLDARLLDSNPATATPPVAEDWKEVDFHMRNLRRKSMAVLQQIVAPDQTLPNRPAK